MARREFHFVEGTSSKFWAVTVEDSTLRIQYGKIGSGGQTQLKSFASPAEAEKGAAKFIAEAVKRKEPATPKEQKWIDAAAAYFSNDGDDQSRRRNYVEALEKLVREFPDDLEPKAALALQIYKNGEHGIPVASRQAVESLMQEVLRAEPMHP